LRVDLSKLLVLLIQSLKHSLLTLILHPNNPKLLTKHNPSLTVQANLVLLPNHRQSRLPNLALINLQISLANDHPINELVFGPIQLNIPREECLVDLLFEELAAFLLVGDAGGTLLQLAG
jgi:hypothetical protein